MDSHQHHQCARWPRTSHGSVDGQRTDRLGRQLLSMHLRQVQPRHRQLDSQQHHQRARWPTWSHGSVDWQRNDRLGRMEWGHLFQHRRQILRGCANTHTNAYPYIDAKTNCITYSYSNANAYSNVHANADANTNCITYSYSNANADPDTNAMRGEMC